MLYTTIYTTIYPPAAKIMFLVCVSTSLVKTHDSGSDSKQSIGKSHEKVCEPEGKRKKKNSMFFHYIIILEV